MSKESSSNRSAKRRPKTQREREVAQARRVLDDEKLQSFLRALRHDPNVFALKLVNEELDEGLSLDEIFFTGEEPGYTLEVEQKGPSLFRIRFGCEAGVCAGDGGEWEVAFGETNQVLSSQGGDRWVS